MDLIAWYSSRFSILFDTWSDIRVLLKLRENSGPAETLKMIKERLDQTDTELKELIYDEKES